MSSNKVKAPLANAQFRFLLELSSRCKEEDLLSGEERKALFQAGRYPNWYASRVEKICNILRSLQASFHEPEYQNRIQEILQSLSEFDVELEQLEFDAGDACETPSALFRRAEIYFENGNTNAAKEIFMRLREGNFDTEDVQFYLRQINSE